ncbi:NAD(+)/NADH kinase [Anaerolentibacter hominis]|uniref:NAD(+)/NADH kinase n=1 Tax=Anaerolentibacter hominis TaxID=3079009 RepID=UPI0031B8673B
MEKFCVIANAEKKKSSELANYIQTYLVNRGKSCRIMEDVLHSDGRYTDVSQIPEGTECVLVIGGDGTLIQAAVDLIHRDIPLVGINLGTLGFLNEVEEHNIEKALRRLTEDKFTVENRMMLAGHTVCGEKTGKEDYALNDVVISKAGHTSMIKVKVYINGGLIDSFVGDGVIVCTPTGSTGYNLSAGGPVTVPETTVFTITPICPHSLNKRSLVVSSGECITLEICQRKEGILEEAIASFDGRFGGDLRVGDKVEIVQAQGSTKLIKLTDMSFFDILRNKLNK